jgi:hypothetical protein
MKMLAEYLEKAINFELMAAEEKDERLKASLLAQAAGATAELGTPAIFICCLP